jgi:D-glycero-D-manno-heptose 1,7-bisphosphate phosphatase
MPRSGRSLQAIFLDRDGTLNRERADYVKTWQEYEWLPGALTALAQLATLELPILVISNQSAIGRGILRVDELDSVHAKARAEALASGGRIDEFFVCPHAPGEGCDCRKPKPGLLKAAAAQYNLDLERCVFVGDSITDMQAAVAAGCAWILVRTGRQGGSLDSMLAALESAAANTQVVDDLGAAAALIMAQAVDAQAFAAEAAGHLHCEKSGE